MYCTQLNPYPIRAHVRCAYTFILMHTYFSIHMCAPTHSQEQIEELTTMLEAEREKSGVHTVVEHSALVCTLILVHSLL